MKSSLTENDIIIVCIFFLTGFIIYVNSLNVPFTFDDSSNIISASKEITSFSGDELIDAAVGGLAPRRPVSNLSYALNWLINKYNVTGYHIVNVLIHIFAATSLYFLLKLTFSLPVNSLKYEKFTSLAFVASLLWISHPLATQSVTYIVQRNTSMATFFYLLSLLLYVNGRLKQQTGSKRFWHIRQPTIYFISSFGCWLLAVGSKEIAVTLPIVVFLYEWYFFQDLNWQWVRKKTPWFLGAGIIVIFWFFVFLGKNPLSNILHSCDNREFSTVERLLTELRVALHYISLMIYPNPNRLTFDYDFPLSTTFFNPISTIWSFAFLFTLFTAALVYSKKERFLSFCILWFFITLLVESTVICLEIIYEHRTYLPLTFFLTGFIAICHRLLQKNIIAALFTVCIAILFGLWTIERNSTWQDHVTFWEDNVSKSPDKPRTLNGLANAYLEKGDMTKALEYYEKAITADPNYFQGWYNFGFLYYYLGNYGKAVECFKQAINAYPIHAPSHNGLGMVYLVGNQFADAIREFRIALYSNRSHFVVNSNMGEALMNQDRDDKALFFLHNALNQRPGATDVMLKIATIYQSHGREKDAIAMYQRILEINTSSAAAHYNLARLLDPITSFDKIYFHYLKAVEYNPSFIPASYNLANFLLRHYKRTAEAGELYQKIISHAPELAGASNNYGLILAEKGQYKKAEEFFANALRIEPTNEQYYRNLMQARQDIQNNK